MNPQNNFVFFGTPSVASATLAYLVEHGFTPALVVTSPDAPQGRGLVLTPSPTAAYAEEYGIPVYKPEKLSPSAVEEIARYGCAYAIVVAYGKIFPETLIGAFPKGVLNVHYSLLPKYRGATPTEAALLAGDAVTGITVQTMAKELDAGDIVAQKEMEIGQMETVRELRPRLIEAGAELLAQALPAYLSGEITPTAQDHAQATRAGKLKKEDGELDLSGDAALNWRKYRAYADSIGTYFFENGKRMKITKASFKNGAFVVERVIPEGKREMDYGK